MHGFRSKFRQKRQSKMATLELGNKQFNGTGAVRQLAAGHTFSLSQHAHYALGNNTFIVTAVDHAASNNVDAGIARLLKVSDLERSTYRNCVSKPLMKLLVSPLFHCRPCPATMLSPALALMAMMGSVLCGSLSWLAAMFFLRRRFWLDLRFLD